MREIRTLYLLIEIEITIIYDLLHVTITLNTQLIHYLSNIVHKEWDPLRNFTPGRISAG